MHTDLSQQQCLAYARDGFLVLDRFLEPDELAAWRLAVDEAVARRDGRKLPTSGTRDDPDDYYNNVFAQRINLWMDHEGVRALMLDARLGKMAATLAGVDGIRIWHDQALIKGPWGNPTAWHLDNPYWSFSSRQAISIWVALDDATLENGCLYYAPGTHLTARFDNVGIGQNIGDLFRVYKEWGKRTAVAAPVKAGGCIFHNGLVAHGAGANMTPGYRRAMTCAYMPAGSRFNGKRNVLPPDYVESLEIGDLLDNEALNPLIYAHAP